MYKCLLQLRIIGYQKGLLKHYSLPCPIISIGNITTGGTGKTPMVIHIARIFRQHGKRVVILTRGYRRKGSTPKVVLPGSKGVVPPLSGANAVDVRESGSPPLVGGVRGGGTKPSGISGKTEASSEIRDSCSPPPNLPHQGGGTLKSTALLRGARGVSFPSREGPGVGSTEVHDVGDEPFLIARKFQQKHNAPLPDVRVVVGSRRYLSGQFAIEQFQPDVMLLDDGFQHLQLERRFDLVLIDATNPFGGNHLLPAGFLREPVKNLARAQAFVITRSDEVADISTISQQLHQINPQAPIFRGKHICDEMRIAGTEEHVELDRFKQPRLLSVSGLANPGSFHRILHQRGLTVIKHLDFPDHHWYTEQNARQIQQTIVAQHIDAIITTEKDEAKLLLHSALLKAPLYVMTITLEIQPKEEFESVLLNVIGWS